MAHGGKRAGAGRKTGAKNRRTRELEKAQAKAAKKIERALGKDAFKGDAHALLQSVYKDTSEDMDTRLDAAGKAIKFEKPALAAIDTTVKNTGPTVVEKKQYVYDPGSKAWKIANGVKAEAPALKSVKA